MADTFGMDPQQAADWATQAERAQSATGKTKDHIAEISSTLGDANTRYENIVKLAHELNLDDSFIRSLGEVNTSMQGMGKSLINVIQQTKMAGKSARVYNNELKAQQNTLKSIRTLTKQLASDAKERAVSSRAAAAKELKDGANKKKQDVDEKTNNSYINRQKREVADTMAKMAGLGGIITKNNKGMELSFAGIIKKIIDLRDQTQQIEGYGMKAAASFKGGQKSIGAATGAIKQLRGAFSMDYPEAGELVASLTRAGVEASDLAGNSMRVTAGLTKQRDLSTSMVAMQYTQNRSVETQLKNIMYLRNNFNMYVSDAQKLDVIMANVGTSIAGLSAEEAVEDIRNMASGMRQFNRNAIDAVTLYKTLMRDAEDYRESEARANAMEEAMVKLEAPREPGKGRRDTIRGPRMESTFGEDILSLPVEDMKEFAKWITTFPATMDKTKQAILGKYTAAGAQHGPGEWFDDFRDSIKAAGKNGPIEFMRLLSKFFADTMTGLSPGEKKWAIEDQLGAFKAPENMLRMISGGFAKGTYDDKYFAQLGKKLDDAAKEIGKSEAGKAAREKLMDDLLATGKAIATHLMGLEEWLTKKIENIMLPIAELGTVIEDLIGAIRDFSWWSDKKEDFNPKTEAQRALLRSTKGAPEAVSDRLKSTINADSKNVRSDQVKKLHRMILGVVSRNEIQGFEAKDKDKEFADYLNQKRGQLMKGMTNQQKSKYFNLLDQGSEDLLLQFAQQINEQNKAKNKKSDSAKQRAVNTAAAEAAKKNIVSSAEPPGMQEARQEDNGVQ
jgi:hypothetical protein